MQARPYLSPAIALLFALIVLWRGLPAAYDAYAAGAGTGGDLGYLLDASELVTSSGESKMLYGPGPAGLDQRQYKAIYGHEYPYYYPYAPAFALRDVTARSYLRLGRRFRRHHAAAALEAAGRRSV